MPGTHDLPALPLALPLPFFFSGTSGTLTEKPSVSIANTGFKLSHSEWDTSPFLVGQVGQFVPVALLAARPSLSRGDGAGLVRWPSEGQAFSVLVQITLRPQNRDER